MKTNFMFFITLFFFSKIAFSQNTLAKIDVKLKNRSEVISITDKNQNTALLLLTDDIVKAYLFDKDYQLLKEMAFTGVPFRGNYETKIAGIGEGNIYNLYFSNSANTIFSKLTFNFEKQNYSFDSTPFQLENDSYLESFTENNNLYVLSYSSKYKSLTINEFTTDNKYKSYSFPITKSFKKSDIAFISSETINSLGITHKTNKIYLSNNKRLYITFDTESDSTQLFIFDLQQNKSSFIAFPQMQTVSKVKASNSFIFNEKIYQASTSVEECYLKVTDIVTGKELKTFHFTQTDQTIPFANTAIIQERGIEGENKKELTKVKQLLHKINTSNVAIAVNQSTKTDLVLTLGSFKYLPTGGGGGSAPMMMGGSTISTPYGVVSTPATFHTIYYGYLNSESNTQSAYFKTLLDITTQDSKQGVVEESAFEKINNFERKIESKSIETIYKCGNYYVYGYYDKELQKYLLKKFY